MSLIIWNIVESTQASQAEYEALKTSVYSVQAMPQYKFLNNTPIESEDISQVIGLFNDYAKEIKLHQEYKKCNFDVVVYNINSHSWGRHILIK